MNRDNAFPGGTTAQPGRKPGPFRSGTDRAGIALVIVLGFLTLLTILAVSFAISMRTERLSAGLYVHSVQARHLAHAAVARAMAAIEEDMGWRYETNVVSGFGNVERYNYTPMAPTWVVMASTNGTGGAVDLLTGDTREYLPTNAVLQAQALGGNIRWQNIEVDGMTIGRYAFLVADCTGLMDITAGGKQPRDLSNTDPRGIQVVPQHLFEFGTEPNYNQFRAALSNQWERIESLAELRRLPGFSGAPRDVFFWSYAPNHEWFDRYHQIVRPRIAIGTNYADAVARKDDIIWALNQRSFDHDRRPGSGRPVAASAIPDGQGSGAFPANAPIDAEKFFHNHLDYLDEDWIPGWSRQDGFFVDHATALRSIAREPIPLINEIIFTNRVMGSTNTGAALSSSWTNRLDVVVEITFPWATLDNSRTYQLGVGINCPFPIGNLRLNFTNNFTMTGPWTPNEYRLFHLTGTVTETLPGLFAQLPMAYSVSASIRDMSGADAAAGHQVGIMENHLLTSTEILGVPNLTATVDRERIISRTPSRGWRANPHVNWNGNHYETRRTATLPGVAHVDGLDWRDVITPRMFNFIWYYESGVSTGSFSAAHMSHSRSQDRIDHVEEWGRCWAISGSGNSVNRFDFRTIASMGSGANRVPRDYQDFDRFTVTTNLPPRGTINPNTASVSVLANAFHGIRLEQYAGVPGVLRWTSFCGCGLASPHAARPATCCDLPGRFELETSPSRTTIDRFASWNLAEKFMFDRDYRYSPDHMNLHYYPWLRSTQQTMAWDDIVSRPRILHFMRWEVFSGPNSPGLGLAFHSAYPDRNSPPPYSSSLDSVFAGRNLQRPSAPDNQALNSESWEYWPNVLRHFVELLNPRQNLYTIVVAAQSVTPRPAGAPVTDEDVMSERRALLVVWRDPWPTPPSDYQPLNPARGYDPYADPCTYLQPNNPHAYPRPSQRSHKAFVRFFRWLDE